MVRRRFRRKRFLAGTFLKRFFVLLAVFSAFVLFFHIPQFRIKEVRVEKTELVAAETVRLETEEILAQKYFFLFPKNNIFLIPKAEIESRLLEVFSRLKEVSLTRDLPATISISVEEREERALWCLEKPKGQEGQEETQEGEEKEETCYFLDSQGVIFEPAPFFSGSIFAKFLDRRSQKPKPGEIMIGEGEFEKLMAVREFLRIQPGIETEKIFLKDNGEYQFLTKPGWRIFLSERMEKDRLLENFKIAWNSQLKNRSGDLDYVDLRFGNKVFYKFK